MLEVLREPLETGRISISRAQAQVEYPAEFQLIAAMNPCPCGYLGDQRGRCRCTPAQIERYRNKISGPLLDRIDMHIRVDAVPIYTLQDAPEGESSETIKQRVLAARQQQMHRQGKANAELTGKDLHKVCELAAEPRQLLAQAMDKLQLSARAYDRILRVARTLADLVASPEIDARHISEALAYRNLDRAVC